MGVWGGAPTRGPPGGQRQRTILQTCFFRHATGSGPVLFISISRPPCVCLRFPPRIRRRIRRVAQLTRQHVFPLRDLHVSVCREAEDACRGLSEPFGSAPPPPPPPPPPLGLTLNAAPSAPCSCPCRVVKSICDFLMAFLW